MARTETRGKRDRRADKHDGQLTGPIETDAKPSDAELKKLMPTKAEVRKMRDRTE